MSRDSIMVPAKKESRAGALLKKIFPAVFSGRGETGLGISPPSEGGLASMSVERLHSAMLDSMQGGGPNITLSSSEDCRVEYELPAERTAKYAVFSTMATDPTVSTAIRMHVAQAMSADSETGEIISIKSKSGKDKDPIVQDLKNCLGPLINKRVRAWAFTAAVYGCSAVRIYGQPGLGITRLRHDYYTHPQHIKIYERGGEIAGYAPANQKTYYTNQILMEPWRFVCFRLPSWSVPDREPEVAGRGQIFIDEENLKEEPLVETQNYGQSLLENAYSPWASLQEALVSLSASRKNASRIERIFQVGTAGLGVKESADLTAAITDQIRRAGQQRMEQARKRGLIPTIINHFFPVSSDGKGNVDTSTLEGDPNIDGLADLDLHIKRLCSALGIDPALVGFGEMLSGGLGDGGFFRLSIMAGLIASLIREAVLDGLEELAAIHVAYKFNKVFTPEDRPWQFEFNSLSSSIEREEMENRDARVNQASLVLQTIGLVDQEMRHVEKHELLRWFWTEVVKQTPESFDTIFKAEPDPSPEEEGDFDMGEDDDDEEY